MSVGEMPLNPRQRLVKKAFFTFAWFIILYVGGCLVSGAIAVGVYCKDHPGEKLSQHEAGEIGRTEGPKYITPVTGGVLGLVIAGSVFGLLPGTRIDRPVTTQQPDKYSRTPRKSIATGDPPATDGRDSRQA
jgi:hypothetical protein